MAASMLNPLTQNDVHHCDVKVYGVGTLHTRRVPAVNYYGHLPLALIPAV